MKSSEDKLVKACLQGDAHQQKRLYDNYKVNLFVMCLRYAKDRAEAEDFLQEGFIKIFQDLHQFDSSKGTLSAWTRRVVLNTIFQYLRKKRIQISSAPIEEFARRFQQSRRYIGYYECRRIDDHHKTTSRWVPYGF